MPARGRRSVTLVELVIVMAVSGVLCVLIPQLMFYGVRTLVFLPKALAVNQVADEILQQAVEGEISTVTGQRIFGLRFTGRPTNPAQPAIWLAEAERLGSINSGTQSVLIRLDQGQVKRSFPGASCTPTIAQEEVLPYHAPLSGSQVTVERITPATPVFRYYNQAGTEVVPSCPPGQTAATQIRRVDIAFAVRTGSGAVGESDAREPVTSSVAVRIP